ncbi:MAG: hypothetical protein UX13_C0015G0007 [Candidatus Woesebacteria bacterium GW2011_GWB1_45_5]|uniref:Uncharacterized protein n=1 Tax=Candidatus Woesebacteria bacterium GW2011_GWB1_45_5 TaxID=1618581 RepID=A0A0G1PXX2_9BACT|nr:MAG: hypothetical protein UX13_C0015G0007 [Candidatus Woesebacteria bacterium GW2011_GWB1_45_5]
MNKVNSVFKNCRKAVSVVLCFLLLVERSVTYSYSQEAESSPAPTPTETPSETSTENLSDVTNNVDSGTETGENSIEFTSPSPTPSPSENPLTEAGEHPPRFLWGLLKNLHRPPARLPFPRLKPEIPFLLSMWTTKLIQISLIPNLSITR